MKDKLIIFIIGVLVGAIISTGAFLAYTKLATCNTNDNGRMQMGGGNPPSMQDGQPPEKPDENNNQNNTQSNN